MLLHTYSVVAVDASTGQLGVAVQSHWFNVGRLVPWARAGVGAVATQSMVDVAYGPRGLDLMGAGASASEALGLLLAEDEERSVRQVAMVDQGGDVAVHTGDRCIEVASHQTGPGWSVQANIMRTADVVPAMAEVMAAETGDLSERMLGALLAAEASGGDLRGSQSASLLIVGRDRPEPLVDLRVEDHPAPVDELERLVTVAGAYEEMNIGDEALGRGDILASNDAYAAAAARSDNPEILFWHAVGLARAGEADRGVEVLRRAVAENPDLAVLLARLPRSGLFPAELADRLIGSLEDPSGR